MSNYKSSLEIQRPRASSSRSTVFAIVENTTKENLAHQREQSPSRTASVVESIPAKKRWWINNFHLGDEKTVRRIRQRQPRTAATKAVFYTPSGSGSSINHLSFAGTRSDGVLGSGSTNPPYQLAVSAGPRVSLYGGTRSTPLSRSLLYNGGGDKIEVEMDGEGGRVLKKIKPDRSVGTSGRPSLCSSYREDGRLIIVGCDDGYVRVCDSTTRATLRTFKCANGAGGGSGLSVRTVGWIPVDVIKSLSATDDTGGRMIWSGGDDGRVRIWGIGGGSGSADKALELSDNARPTLELVGHGDAVRDCIFVICSTSNTLSAKKEEKKHLLITGSYDHTIRGWDVRGLGNNNGIDNEPKDRCLWSSNHGSPIECLLSISPSGYCSKKSAFPLVVSAGGTTVKIWDALTGLLKRTLNTRHRKTITSLCFYTLPPSTGQGDEDKVMDNEDRLGRRHRLLTAGLDGLIRIHDASTLFDEAASLSGSQIPDLPLVHGINTPYFFTSMAISPDGGRIAFGTNTGIVIIRQKAGRITALGPLPKKRKKYIRAGTHSHFNRGMSEGPNNTNDHVVELKEGRERLKQFDVLLKQFQYSDALDESLRMRDPNSIVAVIEELGRTNGLTRALSGRDEETLEPILSFITNFISEPKYAAILTGVATILCNIYADVVPGQSDVIDREFVRLKQKVRDECRAQKILHGLIGQIDTVMHAFGCDSE